MWNAAVAGTDFYHIINWFFIYSFLGWVWESAYVSIKEKRLVNRGFVTGPLCTIYGCGAVAVYLILRPVSENLLLLFLGGIAVPTILEYLTAVLMEYIFHTSWWDYSKNKFNFQGRICLGASLGWGVFTVILFYVLQPFVEWIVSLYPEAVGRVMVCIAGALYLVDFGSYFANAMHIGKKHHGMDEVMDEVYEYVQSVRQAQRYPVVPMELKRDIMRIDHYISGDTCFVAFDSQGQLNTDAGVFEGEEYNVFSRELRDILRLALRKN